MVNVHFTYARLHACVWTVLNSTYLAVMNDHNHVVLNNRICVALCRFKLLDNHVTLLI